MYVHQYEKKIIMIIKKKKSTNKMPHPNHKTASHQAFPCKTKCWDRSKQQKYLFPTKRKKGHSNGDSHHTFPPLTLFLHFPHTVFLPLNLFFPSIFYPQVQFSSGNALTLSHERVREKEYTGHIKE